MNDEIPFFESWIERFVIAEGDIRDRNVEIAVSESGLLERLMPNVGIGVERYGKVDPETAKGNEDPSGKGSCSGRKVRSGEADSIYPD